MKRDERGVHGVDLLAVLLDDCLCLRGGVCFLGFDAEKHLVCPLGLEGVGLHELGDVEIECFLADIGFGAMGDALRLAGAAVVGVAFLGLGGDGTATRGARECASVWEGFECLCRRMKADAFGSDGLNAVEKLFGDDRFVNASVNFAVPAEESVVEGIGEDLADTHPAHRFLSFSSTRTDPSGKEEIPDVVDGVASCRIPLECLTHDRRSYAIDRDALRSAVV